MGKRSTFDHCNMVIEMYEEYEADDFEDTTREERHWMDTAHGLALALRDTTGYVGCDFDPDL
jgi:uncharacterized phage-associated protein